MPEKKRLGAKDLLMYVGAIIAVIGAILAFSAWNIGYSDGIMPGVYAAVIGVVVAIVGAVSGD